MEAPIAVGDVVAGKFAVERILACGGSGMVVLARHLTLLEPCAIKLLLPEALQAPMARERFLREARAAARIKSEHVVKVFDVGQLADETPYMVMEYLEGIDLEEMLDRRGRLPVTEAATYLLQVCAALAEAHKLGIVHRDLKPANVLVTQVEGSAPRVKLVDFGISKLLVDADGSDPMTTLQGTVMGTPAFMSPEQISAGTVDTRTDIWALGALFYHLVTGKLPFAEADAIMASLTLVLTAPATPPSRYIRDLPPAIEQLILQCLEKRPEDRPASVTEFAAVLAPFVRGETPSSVAPPPLFASDAPPPAPVVAPAQTAPVAAASPPLPSEVPALDKPALETPQTPKPTTLETPAPPALLEPVRPRPVAAPRPPRDGVVVVVTLAVAAVVLLFALALAFGPLPAAPQSAPETPSSAFPAPPAPSASTPAARPASLAPPINP
ncbi:serine/threonine protein kinase [Minicystis rosea]|nr:serine/threonine protein kinase [Minicystis rosea]